MPSGCRRLRRAAGRATPSGGRGCDLQRRPNEDFSFSSPSQQFHHSHGVPMQQQQRASSTPMGTPPTPPLSTSSTAAGAGHDLFEAAEGSAKERERLLGGTAVLRRMATLLLLAVASEELSQWDGDAVGGYFFSAMAKIWLGESLTHSLGDALIKETS
ncbi:hypothetical protein OsI_11284 [Oryza sativa Indica Group]|uniref:Uncharacterized protein n=1 Tax=Oryza sativa subsp. indica TaxID=39946 RepID=B8AN06_ORYSI|nr:hypothetical protein OsI_11284 [Oryza sativa Indica Group]